MKKFYTLALALGCAASSFAFNAPEAMQLQRAGAGEFSIISGSKLEVVKNMTTNSTRATADFDYDSIDDWKARGMGEIKENMINQFFDMAMEAKECSFEESESYPGIWRIKNWLNADSEGDIYLIIDARDHNHILIPLQPTGVQIPVTDQQGNKMTVVLGIQGVVDEFVDEFNNDFAVIFQENPGLENYNITEDIENKYAYIPENAVNYYCYEIDANGQLADKPFSRLNAADSRGAGFIVFPGGKEINPWESVGQCTFKDNLIMGMFFVEKDATDEEADEIITSQKDLQWNQFTKQFRVADAWNHVNDQYIMSAGNFIFSIDDPNMCSVPSQNTGLDFGEDTINGQKVTGTISFLGLYPNFQGYQTAEEINKVGMAIKYDPTTLTLTIPAGKKVGDGAVTPVLYQWEYTDGELSKNDWWLFITPGETKIIFPKEINGVNNVEIDNSNAPVEYFNIQGVRVNNPQAGQLVIKRQGSNVTKMIVR